MKANYKIIFIFTILFIYCKSDPFINYIKHYQKHETQINGSRCPLYPTCSEYAIKSYNNNKIFGFLLTLERLLIRERGDLSKKFIEVPQKLSHDRQRYYDPLENSYERPSFLKDDF